jgi:hypothetical protein
MPTLFHDKQMVLATGKVLFQSQEVASGYRVEEKNKKTPEILKGCRRNCFVRCTAFLTFLN